MKNEERWGKSKPSVRLMNDTTKVKSFIDENMFQLSDILVAATDGHNKSIASQDHWWKDMGEAGAGLFHFLNTSLYNMGTAETSVLMEFDGEVNNEIRIFDPNYFYFTRIKVLYVIS